MANKYWYNGGAAAPWNTLVNWYDSVTDINDLPAGLGDQAAALPTTGDKVFLLGSSPPSDGPGSAETHLALLWFTSFYLAAELPAAVTQYIDIQAGGRLYVGNPEDASVHHWGGTATAAGITHYFASMFINDGILGDGITFGMNELGRNNGTIGDDAVFLDLQANNYGTIGDRCTYPGDNQVGAVIGDDALLVDAHINYGTVGDRATFTENSWNIAVCGGDALFQDSSKNTATINGDATFEDTAYMSGGYVTGDLYVSSTALQTGTCDGDIYAEVAGTQVNVVPGTGKKLYLTTAAATCKFQPELKAATRLTYTTSNFTTTDNLDGTWTIQAKTTTNRKWCPYTVNVFLTNNDPEADPLTYSDYDDGNGNGFGESSWVFDYVNGKLTVPFQPKDGATYGYITLVKNWTPPLSQTIEIAPQAGLVEGNIKSGVTILGVTGNDPRGGGMLDIG